MQPGERGCGVEGLVVAVAGADLVQGGKRAAHAAALLNEIGDLQAGPVVVRIGDGQQRSHSVHRVPGGVG